MQGLRTTLAAALSALGISFANAQSLPENPNIAGALKIDPDFSMPKISKPKPIASLRGYCDKELADTLAHRDLGNLFSSTAMYGTFPSEDVSPETVQDKAADLLAEREVYYDLLFGCDDPANEDLNTLASAMKNGRVNQDSLTKLQNLVIVRHYADIASLYSTDYFLKQASDIAVSYMGANKEIFEEKGLEIDIQNLGQRAVEEIARNHERLVKGTIKSDLEKLFSPTGMSSKKKENDFSMTIEEVMGPLLKEVVLDSIHQKNNEAEPKSSPFFMPDNLEWGMEPRDS